MLRGPLVQLPVSPGPDLLRRQRQHSVKLDVDVDVDVDLDVNVNANLDDRLVDDQIILVNMATTPSKRQIPRS